MDGILRNGPPLLLSVDARARGGDPFRNGYKKRVKKEGGGFLGGGGALNLLLKGRKRGISQ